MRDIYVAASLLPHKSLTLKKPSTEAPAKSLPAPRFVVPQPIKPIPEVVIVSSTAAVPAAIATAAI
jgi:hypothetical protein